MPEPRRLLSWRSILTAGRRLTWSGRTISPKPLCIERRLIVESSFCGGRAPDFLRRPVPPVYRGASKFF